MNNSKKVNGKSSIRVYSRSDRAITLIALIVTIIVLLILAGVTINLAVNNQGIFNKAKTATRAFKNASENEQTGLDEADKEIAKYMPKGASEGGSGSESSGGTSGSGNSSSGTSETGNSGSVATGKGTTLSSSSFPKISVSGLKYADLDGDGIADGIIVADISKDSTDTKVTSRLRGYSENTYKYTNTDGTQVDGTLIKCTNNTGIPRYYILSLADYDANEHYWYKNADMSDYSTFTSIEFGKGKENTEKMIDRMKNHSDTSKYSVDYGEATTGTYADIWNIIEDKVKEGWFVPSKAEWSTFMTNLKAQGLTTSDYSSSFGLNNYYWSSSQYASNGAWYVSFGNGYVDSNFVDDIYGLRLCATF